MDKDWLYYSFIKISRQKKETLKRVLKKAGINLKPSSIDMIKKYAGKQMLGLEEYHLLVYDKIKNNVPFMVGRFGNREIRTICSFLQKKHFPYLDDRKKQLTNLCNSAGFFPNNMELAEKFVAVMLDSCQYIDICGIWNTFYMEDYILSQYAPQAELIALGSLAPWYAPLYNSEYRGILWTGALRDKKVLIIHPFEDSIISQYRMNREKIFKNVRGGEDILPIFELRTLKAVQTINCNIEGYSYQDWFEALDDMVEKCRNIDFEVAIIGCGAYGFPLAAEIKKMGKVAVHLGGETQLLFGIKGQRWEGTEYSTINRMMNEYWIRPSDKEKVKKADLIENSCYW